MIVVSDASPLVALLNAGRISLLQDLHGRVLIPTAVRNEVLRRGPIQGFPPDWIVVADPAGPPPPEAASLDPGETAALTLALELAADLVVVDERRGRRVAAELGLPYVGLLGLVAQAKAAGVIPSARPVIDELIVAGLHVSAKLRAEVLELVDEADE